MITSWKYKELVFNFLEENDIPLIVKILHDPEVEKYLYFAPVTIEAIRVFSLPIIEKQKQSFLNKQYPESATFTVRQNGELLGTCGIDKMQDGHNIAMIGYQLKQSAWGKGVGTRCAEFILHYAKTYLNYRKLFGDCYTENLASARILEKCGFKLEGIIKEKYEVEGELLDNSWYGLNVKDIKIG